jgi:CBS domain-containing protein
MKVRDIMTTSPHVVSTEEPIQSVARILAEEDIGAVIVCDDERLQGMVTDRDIATQVVAKGMDPGATTAGSLLNGGSVFTIDADDDLEAAMRAMREHAVRRLPVIEDHRLVGIVSQADLAASAGGQQVGEMVEDISQAPDNTGRG